MKPKKRCAIYTRKSHEEGLEQAFNSLDAQREAGVDYIRSQKHEGWEVIERQYDDGGFTGGNMKRPGLQALLDDIECGRVDIVLVYKVDRLSRSIHDFAVLMKQFEDSGVSFVSVTQQFNTTTSMGRLTLNMLLSFAQFEREVTGERIRDKLAATKKKGYWVGGTPPLGYRLEEKQLHINPEEAKLINKIFQDYLHIPSLIKLAESLNAKGYTTKYCKRASGKQYGGKPITPKYLYRIKNNKLYIGKIEHKDKVWAGLHEPIIALSLCQSVHTKIESRNNQALYRWENTHLLKGKLAHMKTSQ